MASIAPGLSELRLNEDNETIDLVSESDSSNEITSTTSTSDSFTRSAKKDDNLMHVQESEEENGDDSKNDFVDLVSDSPNESPKLEVKSEEDIKPNLGGSSKKPRGAFVNKKQTMKFLENFDPERSNRERKKLTQQIVTSGKKKPTMHDEKGVLIGSDVDMCDCLSKGCPGCHFPCPKCHSNKCGHECRQNRRWTYEEVWVEGSNTITTNPLLPK